MKTQFDSMGDFKDALNNDAELQTAFKNDPGNAVKSITINPPLPDTWIYRLVIISLGGSTILIITGVILIMMIGNHTKDDIPTILTAIGAAAIGGLAGLLAPSPINNK